MLVCPFFVAVCLCVLHPLEPTTASLSRVASQQGSPTIEIEEWSQALATIDEVQREDVEAARGRMEEWIRNRDLVTIARDFGIKKATALLDALDTRAVGLSLVWLEQRVREARLDILRSSEQVEPDVLIDALEALVSTLQSLGRNESVQELDAELKGLLSEVGAEGQPRWLRWKSRRVVALMVDNDPHAACELARELRNVWAELPSADPLEIMRADLVLTDALASSGALDEALELGETTHRYAHEQPGVPLRDRQRATFGLIRVKFLTGDSAGAFQLIEELDAHNEQKLPLDHPDRLKSRSLYAEMLRQQGQLEAAWEVLTELFERLDQAGSADKLLALNVRLGKASTAKSLGRYQDALDWEEQAIELAESVYPSQHPRVTSLKFNLSNTYADLGRLAESRDLGEQVLGVFEVTLSSLHPHRVIATTALASTLTDLGEIDRPRELLDGLLREYRIAGRLDDPRVPTIQINLARMEKDLGNVGLAFELELSALKVLERSKAQDDRVLLAAKENFGTTLYRLGDLEGARRQYEEVYRVRTELHGEDHVETVRVLSGLATLQAEKGDHLYAIQARRKVLKVNRRGYPQGHPETLFAHFNLASSYYSTGDVERAAVLFDSLEQDYRKFFSEDHPEALGLASNIASALHGMGEFERAGRGFERILEIRSGFLEDADPKMVEVRVNLAQVAASLGDDERAYELESAALALLKEQWGAEHPRVLELESSLCKTCLALGRLEEALEHGVRVHTALVRTYEPSNALVLDTKIALAAVHAELGDFSTAFERLAEFLSGQTHGLAEWSRAAPRMARVHSRKGVDRLSDVLGLARELPTSEREAVHFDVLAFTALEGLRSLSRAAPLAQAALADHDALAELQQEVSYYKGKIGDLVQAKGGAQGTNEALLELIEGRDRAEQELRVQLAVAGAAPPATSADSIAAHLRDGDVLVGYLRYRSRAERADRLAAFRLVPGEGVKCFDLGLVAPIAADVAAWRKGMRRPISSDDTGAVSLPEVKAPVRDRGSITELGLELRGKLVDPLIGTDPDSWPERFLVIPDEFLYALPLDALPVDSGVVLGEVLSVRLLNSVQDVAPTENLRGPDGDLVVVGGLDFSSRPVQSSAVTALHPHPLRSGREASFAPLPASREEVQAIARLYGSEFDGDVRSLTGDGASKEEFRKAVADARWLHIATHGWVLDESIASVADRWETSTGGLGNGQRARPLSLGFAPQALCGLALSGANRDQGPDGSLPGILTAEELSSFDLDECELVVLSACDTNVGLSRAGQGIQSMQSALHEAGARGVVSSLWEVDDEATRQLMLRFYFNLWERELSAAEALWQAKLWMRDHGAPASDWAGWQITGGLD